MKKSRILGLTIGLILAFGSSASAVFVLNDWTIDLTNVDGGINKVINGVSEITYVGMTHAQDVTNYNPAGSVGEFAIVDGLINATALMTGGSVIPLTGMNDSWAMTFDFSVASYNFYADPVTGSQSFVHLAADAPESGFVGSIPYAGYTAAVSSQADGFMDIWIDSYLNDYTVADLTTGLGYTGTDSEMIARFAVNTGSGGIFTPLTFDGSDDATFSLIWAKAGVLSNALYGDLGQYVLEQGALEVLMAMTDSNLDGDPLHDPNIGFDIGVGTYSDPTAEIGIRGSLPETWPFPLKDVGTSGATFLKEDGSAVLAVAVVPEPSTFLLLGAGLMGLALISRKRVRK